MRIRAGGVIAATLLLLLDVGVAGCINLQNLGPPGAFRAMAPMLDGQRNEVGIGASVGGFSDVPARNNAANVYSGGQLWYYHQFARFFDLGVLGYGGFLYDPNHCRGCIGSFGGGLSFRFRLVDKPVFKLGAELHGGFLWVQGGLPMALRLGERYWLYGGPAVAYPPNAFGPEFRATLGLSIRLGRVVSLLFELSPVLPLLYHGQLLFLTGGFGTSFRF